MAITKRLRYEILRRDNHACRYCGGVAPDVVLTIDHVVPVALGGSDDPSNLVTACKDCNAGKSSAPADASLIADVGQDAMRWAAAMRAAFDAELAKQEAVKAYLEEFRHAWNEWKYGPDQTIPLPSDWQRSITKWYGLGLPMAILTAAIRSAMTKRKLTGYDAEFRYMAGVVWSTITKIEEEASAMLEVPQRPRRDGMGEYMEMQAITLIATCDARVIEASGFMRGDR